MKMTHQIGKFSLRSELFEQVRGHMATALTITVTDDVVETFLGQHNQLLGSIVGYDEVDTTDRHNIWDACKSAFLRHSSGTNNRAENHVMAYLRLNLKGECFDQIKVVQRTANTV